MGIEIPKKEAKHHQPNRCQPENSHLSAAMPKEITIFDLVDVNGDWQITKSILKKFKSLDLSPQKVAAGSAEDLNALGFTKEQIDYMRGQLEKSRRVGP